MIYLIIFLILLGLCISLIVANAIVNHIKKKKVKHSGKGDNVN